MDLVIEPDTHRDTLNIRELAWDEIRSDIKKNNKELFAAIEMLDPSKKLTFIKARYPYGATVVDNGATYLPLKSGKTALIHSDTVDNAIKKKLSYSPIPLGLLLNKASEIFIKSNEKAIPLKLVPSGKLFGLFEVTNVLSDIKSVPIWCVSSGARSTFMLPKIRDRIGYQRLRKDLNISLNPPGSMADHWQLFVQISNHPSNINTWHSDVLFFTHEWFSQSYRDPKWSAFYNYLFRESNIQSHYARDEIAFSLTSRCLSSAIENRNLRPRSYIVDTVRHLIAVAMGSLPSFRPSDESAVPTKLLQDIYVNSYGLKNYLPTIMQPYNLMRGCEPKPIYYSLAYPSLLGGTPHNKLHPDIIGDLREVKLLVDTLYNAIQSGKVTLPKAHIILQKTKFEYFHTGKDIYNEMQLATAMLDGDSSLLNGKDAYRNLDFCATAAFLGGCVRITPTSS